MENVEKSTAKNHRAVWLIIMCWLVYTSAYLGRYSYNSNINPIMDYFKTSRADAGLVSTFFFFAYGAGQIINGIFCKYYNKRFVIGGALIISAILNIAVFAGIPFTYIKILWLLNGAVQSVLWPTLIYTLSKNLGDGDLKKSVLAMSTTVTVGTLLTYGLSSLFALFNGFKYSFLSGAVVMAAVAVLWMLFYGKLAANGETSLPENVEEMAETAPEKPRADRAVILVIVMLAIVAVINNLVKDGLTTWVPTILKEKYGLSDSLSIVLTLVLPVLGIFGTAFAVFLSRWIKSFVTLTGVMFLLTAACLAIVAGFSNTEIWILVLIAFGLISLFMYGVNNVITSMAPLYMRDKVNSGMVTGVLNGFCYLGSTISSYGLGLVADSWGWNGVFYLLLGICAVPLILTVITLILSKIKRD